MEISGNETILDGITLSDFLYNTHIYKLGINTKYKRTTLIYLHCMLVTDRSSVLLFCPNRTGQVNISSVSQTETEQNRTVGLTNKQIILS